MAKKHFLVFDSVTIIRKVALVILADLGFSVIETASYDKAMDSCRRMMPDGILLDGMIESELSVNFITYIRSLPGGAKPKIIFTPLEQDAGKLAKLLHFGADDYLLRPFDAEHFKAKLVKLGLI
jgi:two-component system, chemotaxis family, chemotaxis protein CheY